jgi:CRP-like cAMP-binding protein
MDELNEFMAARGLNEDLIMKLKSFYMLKFPTMRIHDEKSVLDGLPKGLARAVKIELFKDILQSSPFFYGMNVSLTVSQADSKGGHHSVAGDICTRIQTLYKTQGLALTTAGEYPDALYIVRSGKLSVQAHGRQIFAAVEDDVIGEMALLGLSTDGRRMRTSVCLSMCELCMLMKEELEELLLLEGFRNPLRRMMVTFVEGLACGVLKDYKDSITNADSVPRSQASEKASAGAFDFNLVPWRLIRNHLSRVDENLETQKNPTVHVSSPPRRGLTKSNLLGSVSHVNLEKMESIQNLGMNCNMLRTDLAIYIQRIRTPSLGFTFKGRKRLVIAASFGQSDSGIRLLWEHRQTCR